MNSPCVAVCELGDDGLCTGCFRTLDEIADWSALDDIGRRRILASLPARRAVRPD